MARGRRIVSEVDDLGELEAAINELNSRAQLLRQKLVAQGLQGRVAGRLYRTTIGAEIVAEVDRFVVRQRLGNVPVVVVKRTKVEPTERIRAKELEHHGETT